LKEASELILESGLTKAQLATYDKYWDTISTERTYVVDAEDRGYKQGIEQGIEQGIQQGVYLVAKKMIASGLSSSEIASITGLTIEQIEALK
jgi:predicted transposase/invertase (TIGR01784 family)